MKKPLLIAEIGINHNGDIEIAKQLIKISRKMDLMQLSFRREILI